MPIEIKITGDTAVDVIADLRNLLGSSADAFVFSHSEGKSSVEVEEAKPKKVRKSRAAAKKPTEPETDPSPVDEPVDKSEEETAKDDKATAIAMLIDLYTSNDKGAKDAIKELLAAYDVKKFTEVPDLEGSVLLEQATAIQAAAE